jgi:hypothetical protein
MPEQQPILSLAYELATEMKSIHGDLDFDHTVTCTRTESVKDNPIVTDDSSDRKRKPVIKPSKNSNKKQRLLDNTAESSVDKSDLDNASDSSKQLNPLPFIPLSKTHLDRKWIEGDAMSSGAEFMSNLAMTAGHDYLTVRDEVDDDHILKMSRALAILFPCDKVFKSTPHLGDIMLRFGLYLHNFTRLSPKPYNHLIRLVYPINTSNAVKLGDRLSAVIASGGQ